EVRQRQYNAAIAGLIGIAPQDEIEGMIAAQLIAAHNATMECYRREMIGEHVEVHAGGQAVIGMIESPRGGDQPKSEDQARAKQIAHAPQPAVWSADKERQPLPVSGDAERPLPDARRDCR